MFKRGVLIIAMGVLALVPALADIEDTVIVLREVEAKGVKFDDYTVGARVKHIDSTTLALNQSSSLADILHQNSLVSITSYGPGGMAGIKMRGGTADHATIVWNGLNIKPPMSGEINLSSLSVSGFDEISIQPGGSSTMYGTGAATGVVFLSNKLNVNNSGFNAGVNLVGGSYGSYHGGTSLGYSGSKFATQLNIGFNRANNAFPLSKSKKGSDAPRLQHAAYNTLSLSQQNALRITTRSKLETDIWYVEHFKEVPSLESNPEPGKTEQTDKNLRMALTYSYIGEDFNFKYRSGYLADSIHYLGYDNNYYHALNSSSSFINEVESRITINKYNKLYIGYNNTLVTAWSDGYDETTKRQQNAIFGRYNSALFNKVLCFDIEARKEFTNNEKVPFIYTGGLRLKILETWHVNALYSKLFSLPDLNDLYWADGAFAKGNKDLSPESGKSFEFGLSHKYHTGNLSISTEINRYYIEMDSAIIWQPIGDDGKYMPDNYRKTFTKGFELNGNIKYTIYNWNLAVNYAGSITDAKVSNDENINKKILPQRRYIPKYKGNIGISIKNGSICINTTVNYVGERLINNVSLALDDYVLANVSTNYTFYLGKIRADSFVKVKNVFNTKYYLLKGYTQPPRTYHIGINLKL